MFRPIKASSGEYRQYWIYLLHNNFLGKHLYSVFIVLFFNTQLEFSLISMNMYHLELKPEWYKLKIK